jgi:hypothetical protein
LTLYSFYVLLRQVSKAFSFALQLVTAILINGDLLYFFVFVLSFNVCAILCFYVLAILLYFIVAAILRPYVFEFLRFYVFAMCLKTNPGPKFWYQKSTAIAIIVKQMRDPVKILSSKVEELMFKYLLPVLKSEEKKNKLDGRLSYCKNNIFNKKLVLSIQYALSNFSFLIFVEVQIIKVQEYFEKFH